MSAKIIDAPSEPQIYDGKARKLYLYSSLGVRGSLVLGWFPDLETFRNQTGAKWGVRCAHVDTPAPEGWHKTGRELANDPIERNKTMRDFVAALTPKRGTKR